MQARKAPKLTRYAKSTLLNIEDDVKSFSLETVDAILSDCNNPIRLAYESVMNNMHHSNFNLMTTVLNKRVALKNSKTFTTTTLAIQHQLTRILELVLLMLLIKSISEKEDYRGSKNFYCDLLSLWIIERMDYILTHVREIEAGNMKPLITTCIVNTFLGVLTIPVSLLSSAFNVVKNTAKITETACTHVGYMSQSLFGQSTHQEIIPHEKSFIEMVQERKNVFNAQPLVANDSKCCIM